MTLSRRELLRLGAGAGISLTFGPSRARGAAASLLAQTAGLATKAVPSSGERLPVIGIGTRNYRAGPSAEEREPYRSTLRKFVELGGGVLDTAPSYGNSESLVGDLMAELGIRGELFLATKVDQEGREAGLERMERSLTLLRTDRVDLMQVHNLRDAEGQLPSLREWKQQGKVRYLGVTTSNDRQYAELERLMKDQELDFVQIDYSLGNRGAAERILPLAADRGAAVLVNLPFGRGRLFETVGDRPLPDWAKEIDCSSWGQVFLKYVVSHPSVTCAIPGTTKEHHAVDNLGAARGQLPDAAMRRRMEEFYDAL